MPKKYFVVEARRFNFSRHQHSYIVGASEKKLDAMKIGRLEMIQRGGKYICYVIPVKNRKVQYRDAIEVEVDMSRDSILLEHKDYKHFIY